MKQIGTIGLGLLLIAGTVTAAAASERLVLYEYFRNTS